MRCCSRGAGVSTHKQFKVAVTKDNLVFASAHFITFPGHRCEKLHGHNYRTRVVVEGGLDPEAHYVLDFSMLKDLMKRLTDEIDHKVLLPLESAKIHVSEEGDTVRVAVAGKPRYVFPRDDCALLPVPNTTVEMLAQYLAGRVCKALAASGGTQSTPRPLPTRARSSTMMAPAPAVTAARARSNGVPESGASASGAPSRRSSEKARRCDPIARATRASASNDGRVSRPTTTRAAPSATSSCARSGLETAASTSSRPRRPESALTSARCTAPPARASRSA